MYEAFCQVIEAQHIHTCRWFEVYSQPSVSLATVGDFAVWLCCWVATSPFTWCCNTLLCASCMVAPVHQLEWWECPGPTPARCLRHEAPPPLRGGGGRGQKPKTKVVVLLRVFGWCLPKKMEGEGLPLWISECIFASFAVPDLHRLACLVVSTLTVIGPNLSFASPWWLAAFAWPTHARFASRWHCTFWDMALYVSVCVPAMALASRQRRPPTILLDTRYLAVRPLCRTCPNSYLSFDAYALFAMVCGCYRATEPKCAGIHNHTEKGRLHHSPKEVKKKR